MTQLSTINKQTTQKQNPKTPKPQNPMTIFANVKTNLEILNQLDYLRRPLHRFIKNITDV